MTRRTLKRLWQAAGLGGTLALIFAWVDSVHHSSGMHAGLSAAGGWRPEAVSCDSALHLVAQKVSPMPVLSGSLGSLFRHADSGYVSRSEIGPELGARSVFPKPFFVHGPATPPGCVGAPAIADRTPPTLLTYIDPAVYVMMPYWLLLSGWIGTWLVVAFILNRIFPGRGSDESQAETR